MLSKAWSSEPFTWKYVGNIKHYYIKHRETRELALSQEAKLSKGRRSGPILGIAGQSGFPSPVLWVLSV